MRRAIYTITRTPAAIAEMHAWVNRLQVVFGHTKLEILGMPIDVELVRVAPHSQLFFGSKTARTAKGPMQAIPRSQ